MAKYLEDKDLYYEIVLSKGKGQLTKKAEKYLELIAVNIIRKKQKDYSDEDEKLDCLQQGLLRLFENWMNFNEKKYDFALPYFSEIAKRGICDGYNLIRNKKSYQDERVRTISIEGSNNGNGLHNI